MATPSVKGALIRLVLARAVKITHTASYRGALLVTTVLELADELHEGWTTSKDYIDFGIGP